MLAQPEMNAAARTNPAIPVEAKLDFVVFFRRQMTAHHDIVEGSIDHQIVTMRYFAEVFLYVG